jgi:hypothetical protein
LVLKVPVETGERPVLLALVLQEQGTLFHSELFQVLVMHDLFWLWLRPTVEWVRNAVA